MDEDAKAELAKARSLRTTVSGVSAMLESNKDPKPVLTADDVAAIRRQLLDAYPDLEKTVKTYVATARAKAAYALAKTSPATAPRLISDLMVAAEEAERALKTLNNSVDVAGAVVVQYVFLCEQEAELREMMLRT